MIYFYFIFLIFFFFFVKRLYSQKLYEKAVEDCSSALSVDPKYTKALARRAKAFESSDRLQEAFEDHTALCILQKFSGSSMASADRIVKKIGEKMGHEIFQVN